MLDYTLVPIRNEDKFAIMDWRNSQVDILRQKNILTREIQEKYFQNTVDNLFKINKPDQLLWSYLYKNELIGYGGLVHIDWDARNGEISFLLDTEHNNNPDIFKKDWEIFLHLIEEIAFLELKFHKIYTYAYNIRNYYFEVMYKCGYALEGRFKEHVSINGKQEDVLFLSKFEKK